MPEDMNNKLLAITWGFAALGSPAALGASFEVVGDGSASARAEFLKLTVRVDAECYSSSRDARRRADELAVGVRDALRPFLEQDMELQLQVLPGLNARAEKTHYVSSTGKTEIVCDLAHGWSSENTIVFKLAKLDRLAEVQDALLSLNASVPELRVNEPRESVALDRPVPAVFETTYEALQDRALRKAHETAVRQVRVLLESQPGAVATLVKVSSTNDSSGAVSYDRTGMSADPTGTSLGAVSVHVSRMFTFKTP
jgi:hypothetical protein